MATADGLRAQNAPQIRVQNRRTLFNIVRHNKAVSRAEIARLTGLSPPAVSAIVQDLVESGHLEEKSRHVGGVGSPSILYGLRREAAFSIGIHIGRRATSIVLLNMSGDVLQDAERAHRYPEPGAVRAFVDGVLADWHARTPVLEDRLVGTGISSPMVFDYAAEDLGYPLEIAEEWAAIDRKALFPRLAAKPVFEENDINAAALAEMEWGQGATLRSFFYIHIGTFIGGGLVLDGALVRGPQGLAATLGAFPVASSRLPSVRSAGDGREFLFRRASLYVLRDHLRHCGFRIDDTLDLSQLPEGCAAAVEDWLRDAAQALAQAVQGIASIIEVEAVILDAPLSKPHLQALISGVKGNLRPVSDRMLVHPQLLTGTAGPLASARGAAMVPFVEVMGIAHQAA